VSGSIIYSRDAACERNKPRVLRECSPGRAARRETLSMKKCRAGPFIPASVNSAGLMYFCLGRVRHCLKHRTAFVRCHNIGLHGIREYFRDAHYGNHAGDYLSR
jgi:hypothetical protein